MGLSIYGYYDDFFQPGSFDILDTELPNYKALAVNNEITPNLSNKHYQDLYSSQHGDNIFLGKGTKLMSTNQEPISLQQGSINFVSFGGEVRETLIKTIEDKDLGIKFRYSSDWDLTNYANDHIYSFFLEKNFNGNPVTVEINIEKLPNSDGIPSSCNIYGDQVFYYSIEGCIPYVNDTIDYAEDTLTFLGEENAKLSLSHIKAGKNYQYPVVETLVEGYYDGETAMFPYKIMFIRSNDTGISLHAYPYDQHNMELQDIIKSFELLYDPITSKENAEISRIGDEIRILIFTPNFDTPPPNVRILETEKMIEIIGKYGNTKTFKELVPIPPDANPRNPTIFYSEGELEIFFRVIK
ncbi:MAG: hypothetical protein AB7U98_01400 [Candidatus Nitrosocosmicus sp.]